jgi:hypothetical protein
MSSLFEGSPQDSRIFAAPAAPGRSWPKIVAAFAAGATCTFVLVMFFAQAPRVSRPLPAAKVAQHADSSKVPQPSTAAIPGAAKRAASPEASKQPAAVPAQESSRAADVPVPAPTATPDGAAKATNEVPCERQTWPYVNHECADAGSDQATRAVRVIPTDRSAPSTVVTAKPQPTPRTTDGMATNEASVALRRPATDGLSQDQTRGVPETGDRREPAGNTGPAQVEVPMPPPKPGALMQGSPGPASGSSEVVRRDPSTAASVRDSRSSRSRNDRQYVQPTHDRRETGKPGSETKRAREETRRETVRGAESAPRMRTGPVAEDADVPASSARLRDGRRVTVEPAEEERGAEIHEQAPKTPFFFNAGALGH